MSHFRDRHAAELPADGLRIAGTFAITGQSPSATRNLVFTPKCVLIFLVPLVDY